MTDETPETGDAVLDLLAFATVASVSLCAGVVGFALLEDLRRKDDNEGKEMER